MNPYFMPHSYRPTHWPHDTWKYCETYYSLILSNWSWQETCFTTVTKLYQIRELRLLDPWRWDREVVPKLWVLRINLRYVPSQKSEGLKRVFDGKKNGLNIFFSKRNISVLVLRLTGSLMPCSVVYCFQYFGGTHVLVYMASHVRRLVVF
jgi:hypothetical protein